MAIYFLLTFLNSKPFSDPKNFGAMGGGFDILLGWIICTIIFIMPSIILQIVTIKCSYRPIPFRRSLIEGVFTGGMVSAIIVSTFILTAFRSDTPETLTRHAIALIVVASVSPFYFLWIVCRSRCCGLDCCGQSDRFMVYDQLRKPVPPPEGGLTRIAANAAAYPVIEIEGWAGHDESYEEADIWEAYDKIVTETITHTREDGSTWKEVQRHTEHINHYVRCVKSAQERVDRGGGHFESTPRLTGYEYCKCITEHTVTKTVWSHKDYYRYGSWDDTTNVPYFPDVVAVTVVGEFEVLVTASARKGIDAMKDSFRRTARSKDTDIRVTEDSDVPNVRKYVTFALDEAEVGRVRKYHAQWWGVMAWALAWLLGFHTAYECFCSLGEDVRDGEGRTVRIKHEKVVSADKDKRAAYNSPDEDARHDVRAKLVSRDMITRA
jgi:hypothetical protein